MAVKSVPTKANLFKVKAQYSLANKGYELLDKKRKVLTQEMSKIEKQKNRIKIEINKKFEEVSKIYEEAVILSGTSEISELSLMISGEPEYNITNYSIMGVDIPEIVFESKPLTASYSLHSSSVAVDESVLAMKDFRNLLYEYVKSVIGVKKLKNEVEKTSKRVNALEKLLIPRYKNTIKEIDDALEEKEREDFFRLKKVKNKKSKQ